MTKARPIKALPGFLVEADENLTSFFLFVCLFCIRMPAASKTASVASHFCCIVGRACPKREPRPGLGKQRDE